MQEEKDKNKKVSIFKKIFATKKRTIVFLIILIAIFYWIYLVSKKDDDVKQDEIRKGVVREELVLLGEIVAEEHANLSFMSSGEIDHVAVLEGQVVKKDEVLAKLDPTITHQAYLSAEDDLRRYQASVDKTYDDVQGSESDETYAERETRTIAETNKDKAYRAYVIAQKNLANLNIKAPFEGLITSVTHPYAGVSTNYTETQIEIVNPDSIYFEVSADQTEVTNIWPGQKVGIVLDSFSDQEMEGEVVYVGYTPKSGDIGVAYKVKVKILSEFDRKKTRIGMSGDAKFLVTEKMNALYVLPSFVNSDTNGKYVNLGRKNNKRYVDVGVEGEERIEIIGDIKEGDKVYD